jgi:hypothetical protein
LLTYDGLTGTVYIPGPHMLLLLLLL